MNELGEGFVAHDYHKYMLAIQNAPPGTLIMLGDLEDKMVLCTTCNSRMESKAAQYHKHPVLCLTCSKEYDANTERHDENFVVREIGAGTIGHTDGCKVVKL